MCAERRPKLSDVIAAKPNTSPEERSDAAANLLAWARCHDTKAKGSGGLVQVAPGLYLGNKMAAADANLLACKGVVGVCAVGARQVFPGDGHHVSIEDDGAESMLPHFEAACHFIEQHRRRGAVLVHCKGGISRSPTMVIAYLMRHEQLSLADAMEVCCLARPAARPREIFLRDLRLWEEKLIEDRRWQQAFELANGHTLASLQPREPGNSKAEVQSECRRLLDLLQDHCILEAFGEPRETSWQLREAAREAVTDFAESRGWKSFARKQSSIQQEQASSES